MLNEYKQIYKNVADLIPGWEELSKSELLNKYLEVKDNNELANCYMSAIIYKYWSVLSKYAMQCNGSFTKEDYHDWLTHAVLYAIDHKVWTDESKAISKKKDAPNMVVNQCIASTRHQNYQKSNYLKYRDQYTAVSIQAIQEENPNADIVDNSYNDLDNSHFDCWFSSKVKACFNHGDYTKAFVLDAICNGDCFIKKPGVKMLAEYPEGVNTKYKAKYHYGPSTSKFSKSKLVDSIKNIDKNYCKMFSTVFDIDQKSVFEAARNMLSLSDYDLKSEITSTLKSLKLDVTDYMEDEQECSL